MLLMKKDMGGAASVLALAHMIMDRKLKVRLSVLIPAVENAISGTAFRPRDVYRSRKGLTVEVGNTDAEGRLVLADALALADEGAPELLIDMGTLTGAARVALGPDMPPFYTADNSLAAAVANHAAAENDPLWRLPLWQPYDTLLESKVADLNNVGTGSFAGSIVCALFLKRFVDGGTYVVVHEVSRPFRALLLFQPHRRAATRQVEGCDRSGSIPEGFHQRCRICIAPKTVKFLPFPSYRTDSCAPGQ